MAYRFAKPLAAVALLAAMWGLSQAPRRGAWIHAAGGPVRILRFYASVGTVAPGETAKLCYSVENARSVRISPFLSAVYPASDRCIDVVPQHTTHYTILAEGYDGAVATRSLTLPVHEAPAGPPHVLQFALSRSEIHYNSGFERPENVWRFPQARPKT